ncbi:hypothetical protein K523DRAFT_302690 [Schizophyllum commune Tattone D]|nr:hypothetical protein K523DRAFT_302690 [Schizophyllum commune Tattone D]
MSHRYTPLSNPVDDASREMDEAFAGSDDEDDGLNDDAAETRPLNPSGHSASAAGPPMHSPPPSNAPLPASYDFENFDYASMPPPGSPPSPTTRALPNHWGNDNGVVPDFDNEAPLRPTTRGNWLRRKAASVLPTAIVRRFALDYERPTGPIGGGTSNDGVFANVSAKPTAPVRINEGDDTYIVPEDTRAEAPPSYQAAQQDSVPPYWDNTVHAAFSPEVAGEMLVDSMPTGTVFSFMWNMLVSISFQFVGFLLTYVLHTTHAARLGSRAGLGVTLIQYGFALRNRLDSNTSGLQDENPWSNPEEPRPSFSTAAEADSFYGGDFPDNSTSPFANLTEEQASQLVADATTEWLSFFLMTVGWFILLTSVLGFWRVKRWERGILTSQQAANLTPAAREQEQALLGRIERAFGVQLPSRSAGDFFRTGFGLNRSNHDDEDSHHLQAVEEGHAPAREEADLTIEIDPNDPNRERILREALENERRLQEHLRAAGLI